MKPGPYKATVSGSTGEYVWIDHTGYGTDVSGTTWRPDDITDARPLIVLDLKDFDPLATNSTDVSQALRQAAHTLRAQTIEHGILSLLASKIEAQTKPARIPEPGPWGIVKAGLVGIRYLQEFIHDENDTSNGWLALYGTRETKARRHAWGTLIDPTLIREGVTNNE